MKKFLKKVYHKFFGSKSKSKKNAASSVKDKDINDQILKERSLSNRLLKLGIVKGTFGFVGLGIGYLSELFGNDESRSAHLARSGFITIVFDGGRDILSHAYLWLTRPKPREFSEPLSRLKRKAQKNRIKEVEDNKTEVERQALARYKVFLRRQNTFRVLFNTLCMTVVLPSQLKNFNLDRAFDLSFKPSDQVGNMGPIFNMINSPLIMTIMRMITSVTFVYNLVELSKCLLSDEPRRGDPPIYGFGNALAVMGATNSIDQYLRFVYYRPPDIDSRVISDPESIHEIIAAKKEELNRQGREILAEHKRKLFNSPLILLKLTIGVNMYGAYVLHLNAHQLFVNAFNLPAIQHNSLLQKFSNFSKKAESLLLSNSAVQLSSNSKSFDKTAVLNTSTPSPALNLNLAIDQSTAALNCRVDNGNKLAEKPIVDSLNTNIHPERDKGDCKTNLERLLNNKDNPPQATREKVKTQGVANWNNRKKNLKATSYSSEEETEVVTKHDPGFMENNNYRRNKLIELKELYQAKEVKMHVIETEFDSLNKFLNKIPGIKSRIVATQRKKNRIIATFEIDKNTTVTKKSISYELNHNVNYFGQVLKDHLDILVSFYLWQTGHETIDSFLKESVSPSPILTSFNNRAQQAGQCGTTVFDNFRYVISERPGF